MFVLPSDTPGANHRIGFKRPPATSSTRNAYTPIRTSAEARPRCHGRRWRGTTISRNGIRPPTIHSSQNTHCQLPPGRIMLSTARSRGSFPHMIVMYSDATRNRSTASAVAISLRTADHVSSGRLSLSNRCAASATSAISAVPERIAEVTNSGASSAVFQNGRANCRPKIHAVIECSRTAAGNPM